MSEGGNVWGRCGKVEKLETGHWFFLSVVLRSRFDFESLSKFRTNQPNDRDQNSNVSK